MIIAGHGCLRLCVKKFCTQSRKEKEILTAQDTKDNLS